MQIYSNKKQILEAIKNGVIFTRNVNSNNSTEYIVVTYKVNSNIEYANLNSYKSLLKDGSIKETEGTYKQVCTIWGITEYTAIINN